MQVWLSFILATCIWFAVRYLVLKDNKNFDTNSKTKFITKHNIETLKSSKKRQRKQWYENEKSLFSYFQNDSYTKMATPWKVFVTKYGNSELKDFINFENLTTKELKFYENIFEVIKTEYTYLDQLQKLVKASIFSSESNLLTSYDHRRLFGKIDKIYLLNKNLFTQFEEFFDSDFSMLDIFNILKQFLSDKTVRDCYVEYNRFHEERNDLLISLSKKPQIAKLELQSLTIVPVQRITRYSLLLQSILSHFPYNIISDDQTENEEKFNYECIESTLKTAINFANCCNKELDSERKLINLAKLKNQIDDKIVAVKEFVSKDREILQDINVKIYPVKIDDSFGSALHNFSASFIKTKRIRLILLTDLMLLLSENKHKKIKWKILEQEFLTSIELSFPKNEQQFSPKGFQSFIKRSSIDEDCIINSSLLDDELGRSYSRPHSVTLISHSSSESDEKQSTDSTGSISGCDPNIKISFTKSRRNFALIFSTEEEEDAFVMEFHRQRSQLLNM